MFADFPPSSRQTRLTRSRRSLADLDAGLVEPVKEIMSTSGWADRAWPTTLPLPITRLKTPFGHAGLFKHPASMIALTGDASRA